MGMFDNIRCAYPLPIKGANDIEYQTKSFEFPSCNTYMISQPGFLLNTRLQTVDFTGELRFYTIYKYGPDGEIVQDYQRNGWLEWSADFVKGKLQSIKVLEDRKPEMRLSYE